MKYMLKAISLISLIASELPDILEDDKVTIRELVDLAAKIAEKLGYDIDDEGLSLQPTSDD